MRGYKATINGKCINLTYEVGKTYTFIGKLTMCARGFHFCKELKDVFEYYCQSNIVVFEIDVLGEVIDGYAKSVTNKLKVLRVVDPSEYQEWYRTDSKGNIIFHTGNKHKYDDKGNKIYYEDSNGYWEKFNYDDKGNLIYYRDISGEQLSIIIE